MATVLNVAIGKNANMFSAQHTAVAQRLSGRPFYKSFVGDIGVGPLVDADEIGASRQGDRHCRDRRVSQNVNAQRHSKTFTNFLGNDRHQR